MQGATVINECDNVDDTQEISEETENMINLWKGFLKTRDVDMRNEIVMYYSHLVKGTAMRMRGIYKNYAQMEDIVNQGIIALIDAVEKFDPSKGVKFQTFASIKVRGAVIDYIRSQDWVPRRLRKMSGDFENTYNKLYSELGRQPSNQEIAVEMNISVDQLDRIMEQSYNFNLLSYEEVIWQKMSSMGEEPETESPEDIPEKKFLEGELHEYLVQAIDTLNEREKLTISLYYREDLKLKEIAQVLGVSESRVSQIHSAAIMKMRKNMKNYIVD